MQTAIRFIRTLRKLYHVYSFVLQPWGRVCGFHPSLRPYLRGSPIICIFDVVAVIIRFLSNLRADPSPSRAAKGVAVAREATDVINRNHVRDIPEVDTAFVLRAVFVVLGALPRFVKLMFYSGIPWTKVWASFYLVEFLLVGMIKFLASSEDVKKSRHNIEEPRVNVEEPRVNVQEPRDK